MAVAPEDAGNCRYGEALEVHLQSSDPKVRQHSVIILGHVGERAHPSHAPVVVKRFQDSEPAVFASTAVALARLGAPGAAALAKELGEERSELEQQVVCEALGRMPNWQAAVAHVPALMARLQDSAVNTRRAAAEAVCRLTFIGPKEALDACPGLQHQLVGCLKDREALVRAAAATAEAHTASAGGADVLGSLLKEDIPDSDEDETSVRSLRIAAALHGLSQCPDEFVSPWIHLVVHRLDDPSPSVQHAAKVALGCLGSSCADSIAEGLSTEDPSLRSGLAGALGYVGCPNALPFTNLLAKLLDRTVETHAEVRIAAAEALCRLGPQAGKSAASALTDYLLLCEGETGSREMQAAQKALVGLQDVTHELLPRILGDPRPEMKCAALEICEALGSVGAELVDGIVESASCPDDLVRQRTVQALSVVSDAAISDKVLPKLLQDPSLLVSKMAVAMAGKLGPAAATHAMAVARHLTSFDPDLRRTAAQSLGQIGQLPKSVAKDIASTFKSEKREEVRRLLIQALAAQGAAASPFGQLFHTNLKDSSVTMRRACIHALGCIGEGAADHAPTVVSLALTDEDESVRQEGVQALGQLGRPGIFALAARLEDPNAASRRSVLEALQVLCKLPVTQEAGPAVMRALKDSTAEVRGAACMTLALLAAEQVAQESSDGQAADKAEEEDKLYQLKVESGLVRRKGTDQAMLVANKLAGLLEEDDSPEVQAGCLHGDSCAGRWLEGPRR